MYRVEVEHQKEFTFKAKSADSEFIIDTNGGGMTPPDTLLASLASCAGVYIRKYAAGTNLALEKFVITAEAELTKEAPSRFSEIRISIDFKGFALDDRRRRALLEFVKNCPVHHTLNGSPDINFEVK